MVFGGIAGGALQSSEITIVIKGVDKFSGTFASAGKGIKGLGLGLISLTTIVTGMATAMIGISSAAISTASSFESAFAGVRKTVNLTEGEFKQLEQRFKDITETTPVTFERLSDIGAIAGQLGVDGVDNIEKFTKTVADISVTTNLTAEQAATDFARIANIMNEPLSNVDRMGAAIVDLGNNFATTESEISVFAQRIAGAANVAGLSTQDIFAIGTAMSSVGVQAEAGGTAVQKVLLNMNEAVATSNDKLQIFAETAGMSAEEFQKAFQEDAAGALAKFINGLGTAGDDAFTILDKLDLKDQRLVRSFLSLANAGDLINETIKTSNKAWDENSALTDEANKRYETFESQVTILKNSIRLLFEQIGRDLIPVMLDMFRVIKEKLIPQIKPLIPVIGDLLARAIENAAYLMEEFGPLIIDIAGEFLNLTSEIMDDLVPVLKNELFPAIKDDLFPVIKSDLVPAIVELVKQLIIFFTDVLIPNLPYLIKFASYVLKIVSALVTVIEKLSAARQAVLNFFGATRSGGGGGSGGSSSPLIGNMSYASPTDLFRGGQNMSYANDFILTKRGQLIKTNPNDTIMGTKSSGGMGGTTIIIQGDIYGVNADDISEALYDKFRRKLSV